MADTSEPDTPFSSAAATDIGRVRSENEDSFVARPDVGLWSVADGMGGHLAGAYASACVTGALAKIGAERDVEALARSCRARLIEANAAIYEFSRTKAGGVVGTTVAALLAVDQRFACVWCGDSRVYRVRGEGIEQLTRDHTEVQEFIDSGALTREEAATWPSRNALTRAIGVARMPQTESIFGDLLPDDAFVICSDGLTLHVNDAEIFAAVRKRTARAGCEHLLELALSRGGKDNVTVIVVQFRPDATRRMHDTRPGETGQT